MPTPSIQTLVTDAQQVLNLDSISAVRSVVAVALANANTGTPLNPNLTTQQLWNEFYQVVTKPKSDIESIIANQLMKFLYAPPAPGGVGANGQVIFNDNGVLAGDAGLTYNKATDALTITGDLTVDTSTLKVDSANNRVGILTATPAAGYVLDINGALRINSDVTLATSGGTVNGYIFGSGSAVYYRTASTNSHIWQNGGTQLAELNSSGNLGLGVTPSAWGSTFKALQIAGGASLMGDSANSYLNANSYYNGTNWIYSTSNGASRTALTTSGIQWFTAPVGAAGNAITFTQAMTLDASGNLLMGTTTAGIGGSANTRFTVKGNSDTYFSLIASGGEEMIAACQAGVIKIGSYNNNRFELLQNNNTKVTIDTSGNFIPLLTATAPALGTNSQMVFNLTSNTNLRISVRGTDGVTRTANITLA